MQASVSFNVSFDAAVPVGAKGWSSCHCYSSPLPSPQLLQEGTFLQPRADCMGREVHEMTRRGKKSGGRKYGPGQKTKKA